MPTREELEETIEAWRDTLAPHADEITGLPGATIEPPPGFAPPGARTLAVVDHLESVRRSGDQVRFTLGERLGEGGMGVVYLADQTSLGRKVAIKTIRAADDDDGGEVATAATAAIDDPAALKLLHEAWITGSLEHPNILPVYDVTLDDGGRPLIVLKRVEGRNWSELIGDAEAVRARFGARDLLEWNLRIFMQVCNAVSFAHSRKIIHRDLKPQNIMIGEFGEVYVLDWGIAVSLADDDDGRIPLARDATEMAGTPLYMAPEMLGGVVKHGLSERTDVYLLGGVLHVILTGAPPHEVNELRSFIASVIAFEPRLPGEAVALLADACRKALEPDPRDRFASVEELRRAVLDFLQFRGSALVTEEASRRLEALEEAVRRGAANSTSHVGEGRRNIYNLFGECRFGFQAALRDWPENQAAADGLARAFTCMVEYELEERDLRSAKTLLDQLADPPAPLRERVERLARETEAARAQARRLVQLGRDLDLRTGHRARSLLVVLVGLMFSVSPLLRDPLTQTQTLDDRLALMAWPAAFLAIAVAIVLAMRATLMRTAINRRFVGSLLLALFSQVAVHVGGALMELPIAAVHTVLFGLWFCISAMMTIALNGRLVYGTLGYLAGFFISARWPELRFYAMSASNLLMTINCTALWLSQRAAHEPAPPPARDR